MSGERTFAVITGANSGLGLHLAKALYRSKSFTNLILACRSLDKGTHAIDEIQQHALSVSGVTMPHVQCLQLDLANTASISAFVKQFSSLCPRGGLRLLVNNAGVMGHPLAFTDGGIEIHFASNHLGHFLLTNLLLEQGLVWTDSGRILIVTSGYYERCSRIPSRNDITNATPSSTTAQPSPNDYYAWSKLANCLHTVALAHRLADSGTGIKVMAIRPGFVRGTQLGRHSNWILRTLAAPLIWAVAKDLDEGIATMVYCALGDEKSLDSGRLYYNSGVEEYKGQLVCKENAARMWELSEKLLESPLRTKEANSVD